MGNLCYSKNTKKTGADVIVVKTIEKEEIFCKPKTSSSSVICYKPKNKSFWEESIQKDIVFQNGCIFGMIGPSNFICVGGLEIGDFAVKLSISPTSVTRITPPPLNLSYGFLHRYGDFVYIIGALSQTTTGSVIASPYLSYSLKQDRWLSMPAPPILLALPGSYIFDSKLFLIGGFLTYPDNPLPFSSLMVFDFFLNSWTTSTIKTPICNGIPNCVVTPHGVIIIGGHDPFDHYVEESREVFLFTGTQFSKCSYLPEMGQLRFCELGMYMQGEVHLYSEDEILFSYDLNSNTWSFIDLEEKLTAVTNVPIFNMQSGYREYIYYYSQKDCELLEYSLNSQSTRVTGPSTFHKFPKYPGIGLLVDGRLMIAGGIDEKLGILKSCWILEPQLHQSFNINDLPNIQYGLNILQISREIFAMCGISNGSALCQKYSLDTEKWKILPNMPYCTFLPGSGYVNGKIYCIGGCAEEEGATILYLVQVFDIKNETWEVLNVEYPFGVLAPGVISVSNNKLLCFGGLCKGGFKVVNTYYFDGNRFALIGELPEDEDSEATCFRDPCVCKGNFVYAFGKNGKLYKFDLQENLWTVEFPSTRI